MSKAQDAGLIREMLRQRAWKDIEAMINLAEDQDIDTRIQFEARKYLIDQAIGKPRGAVEVTGADGGPVKTISADITAILNRLAAGDEVNPLLPGKAADRAPQSASPEAEKDRTALPESKSEE